MKAPLATVGGQHDRTVGIHTKHLQISTHPISKSKQACCRCTSANGNENGMNRLITLLKDLARQGLLVSLGKTLITILVQKLGAQKL